MGVGATAGRIDRIIEKLEGEKREERLEVDCREAVKVRWKRLDNRKRVVRKGEVWMEVKVLEARE
jgi:hypothetical protein